MVRWGIVDHLASEGFEVHQAASADEAIRLLETVPGIRILFTDVEMPGSMDGLKLARAVRDRWPPVQIVVTSGHHIADLAALPPNSRFFPKPYEFNRLVAAFREMVASHS
jgi:DNA-binding NtrC family response regulator